eukprot:TRINITY_DN7364_c0_g1_i3.p1 TRINITY_DN7364_c0_g1~~TRINITY_DN7364_c0_g1_i3.p1  ORF type:complete len:713 (-),score=174.93 TRINITY_DN7364_c0_g1_i3:2053-4191(-)
MEATVLGAFHSTDLECNHLGRAGRLQQLHVRVQRAPRRASPRRPRSTRRPTRTHGWPTRTPRTATQTPAATATLRTRPACTIARRAARRHQQLGQRRAPQASRQKERRTSSDAFAARLAAGGKSAASSTRLQLALKPAASKLIGSSSKFGLGTITKPSGLAAAKSGRGPEAHGATRAPKSTSMSSAAPSPLLMGPVFDTLSTATEHLDKIMSSTSALGSLADKVRAAGKTLLNIGDDIADIAESNNYHASEAKARVADVGTRLERDIESLPRRPSPKPDASKSEEDIEAVLNSAQAKVVDDLRHQLSHEQAKAAAAVDEARRLEGELQGAKTAAAATLAASADEAHAIMANKVAQLELAVIDKDNELDLLTRALEANAESALEQARSIAAVATEPPKQLYEIVRKLGEGGFGVVYLVRLVKDFFGHSCGTLCAMKRNRLSELTGDSTDPSISMILRSISIHRAAEVGGHQHSIGVIGVNIHSCVVEVFMEVADTDLHHLVCAANQLGVRVDREFLVSVFLQLLQVKRYNRQLNILNADQKPANILILLGWCFCTDYDLAIAIARSLVSTDEQSICAMFWECEQPPGTHPYISDEVQQRREIDENTELYAFGIFFYSLIVKFFSQNDIGGDSVIGTIFKAAQKMVLPSDDRPHFDYFYLDILNDVLREAGWITDSQEWHELPHASQKALLEKSAAHINALALLVVRRLYFSIL